MVRHYTPIVFALVLGVETGLTMADSTSCKTVRRCDASSRVHSLVIDADSCPQARIVTRDVVYPGATVSRELSEQLVRRGLIEVRIVNTTVYVDPNEDLVHQGLYPIDEGHFLVRAQILYRNLKGNKVQTIYGSKCGRDRVVGSGADAGLIRKLQERMEQMQEMEELEAPAIPNVPAPPEQKYMKVARAD